MKWVSARPAAPMPRPDRHARRTQEQALALVALAVVGAVMASRAAWLAVRPEAPPAGVSHRAPVAAPVVPKPSQQRLTEQQYAAIAGICPAAVHELPPEVLPPRYAKGPASMAERLSGVRLASRGDRVPLAVAQAGSEGDGWLVPPEEWFVPEDHSAAPAPPRETGIDGAPAAPIEPPAPEPQLPAPNEIELPAGLPEPVVDEPAIDEPVVGEPAVDEPAVDELAVDEPAAAGPGFTAEVEAFPPVEEEEPSGPSGWEGPYDQVAPVPMFDEPAEPEPAREDLDEQSQPQPEAQPETESLPGPAFESTIAPPPLPEPEYVPDPEPQAAPPAEAPPASEPIFAPPTAPEPIEAPASPERMEESAAPVEPPVEPVPEPAEPAPVAAPETVPAVREPIAPPVEVTPAPAKDNKPSGALFSAPSVHPDLGKNAAADARSAAGGKSADESHAELFAKNCYPSAQQCAECHQRAYDQWKVSSHAYAYVSPMFHKFEQTITNLSNGTVGHFCTRCHSPVATALYEPRSAPVGHMADAAKEGVTCIVCHRVNQRWGKSNGERRVVPGDIHAPVYGGLGGDGVAQVAANPKEYKVKLTPDAKGPGVAMHTEGRFFDQLTQAEACTSCHQVAVHPGVKLEVVWEQYRASPACKKGVTCQECHMGKVPGVAAGFDTGPVAEINGKTVNDHRRVHNHTFFGPGYSIAHPGVFPQHKDASDWTMDEWLQYDWRAGWGTDEFEEKVEELEDQGVDPKRLFPPAWAEADDRYDARDVIADNLAALKRKRRYRELVMENGSHVDGPFFREPPAAGRKLKFDYVVTNTNEGHNLPTASLGAQPQLWANVVLIGPDGRRLWETGYTDSNGDLCDIHSEDVRHGRVPFDKQLFNLQTMFLITGATGTDREFPLPVNLDFDQVAHLRPGTIPISVTNHPPFIRMESRSLAALGRKRVKYTVPAELMCQPGRYRLSFRMRNRTEPMYFMRFCDATPEMMRAMTEGTLDIHPQSVEFFVR